VKTKRRNDLRESKKKRTDEQAGERDRDELADSGESKESLRSALRQSRRI
jgi:hypothetical protein